MNGWVQKLPSQRPHNKFQISLGKSFRTKQPLSTTSSSSSSSSSSCWQHPKIYYRTDPPLLLLLFCMIFFLTTPTTYLIAQLLFRKTEKRIFIYKKWKLFRAYVLWQNIFCINWAFYSVNERQYVCASRHGSCWRNKGVNCTGKLCVLQRWTGNRMWCTQNVGKIDIIIVAIVCRYFFMVHLMLRDRLKMPFLCTCINKTIVN